MKYFITDLNVTTLTKHNLYFTKNISTYIMKNHILPNDNMLYSDGNKTKKIVLPVYMYTIVGHGFQKTKQSTYMTFPTLTDLKASCEHMELSLPKRSKRTAANAFPTASGNTSAYTTSTKHKKRKITMINLSIITLLNKWDASKKSYQKMCY